MEGGMKENTSKTKSTGMASSNGPTVVNTMEGGNSGNNTEKESTYPLQGMKKKVNGLMAREYVGSNESIIKLFKFEHGQREFG
jgi:hypothetical protein